jgi:hypothetical protein
MHIAKGLQKRSKTIKNAVTAYNLAASRLDPPREQLTFEQVLEFVHVGEFDLLRNSRQEVQLKPWSRPAERAATTMFFKLQRSYDEILRLKVEARRLLTYIHNEENFLEKCTDSLKATHPDLEHVLELNVAAFKRVNRIHLARLSKLAGDQRFGEILPGRHDNSTRFGHYDEQAGHSNQHIARSQDAVSVEDIDEEGIDDEETDNAMHGALGLLTGPLGLN